MRKGDWLLTVICLLMSCYLGLSLFWFYKTSERIERVEIEISKLYLEEQKLMGEILITKTISQGFDEKLAEYRNNYLAELHAALLLRREKGDK